ncbi:MAG: quinone oxidoreductase [Alphaproteobacteria bacterium]
MPKAIRLHSYGGPENLRWEDVTVGEPGPGEARLRHTAIGLNFTDTYARRGLSTINPPLPLTIGMEGAGIVEAVGAGVTDMKPGQRVCYADRPLGSYAEARLVPTRMLIPLPDDIDDRLAAALILKGLTAQCLLRSVYRVKPGDFVLVHAAAGGMGLILCQWARHLGATVIGTVSTDEKAALAHANGCHHAVVTSRENFVDRVRAIAGEGVHVVYESIGKDTFARSLESLRPLGLCSSYGWASGPNPPFDPAVLGPKSLTLTYTRFSVYNRDRTTMLANAREVFDVVRSGGVKVEIRRAYPLRDAAIAHRDLESRQTVGSNILLP